MRAIFETNCILPTARSLVVGAVSPLNVVVVSFISLRKSCFGIHSGLTKAMQSCWAPSGNQTVLQYWNGRYDSGKQSLKLFE